MFDSIRIELFKQNEMKNNNYNKLMNTLNEYEQILIDTKKFKNINKTNAISHNNTHNNNIDDENRNDEKFSQNKRNNKSINTFENIRFNIFVDEQQIDRSKNKQSKISIVIKC